jgi:hypothetical protein
MATGSIIKNRRGYSLCFIAEEPKLLGRKGRWRWATAPALTKT